MHPEMESQTMRWRCVEWWCGGEVKIRFRSHQHAIPSFLAMLKRALWCCKSYPRAISEKFGKRVERNLPRPPRFGATFSVAFFRFSGAFRCWVLMCVCVPIFTASFRSYNFIVSNHAATPTKEWKKNWDLFFCCCCILDGWFFVVVVCESFTPTLERVLGKGNVQLFRFLKCNISSMECRQKFYPARCLRVHTYLCVYVALTVCVCVLK